MKESIKFWIGLVLIIAIFLGNNYMNDQQLSNSINERATAQKLLDKEKFANYECVAKRDSLSRENISLSQFKVLTQAMIHRDEAIAPLHKVGDPVYMKSDSARGIIEDIIIGGSKYNYYIKYRIIFKNNSSAEVIPELIY